MLVLRASMRWLILSNVSWRGSRHFQALLQGLSVVLVGGSASLLSSMLFLGRSRKDGKESCGA